MPAHVETSMKHGASETSAISPQGRAGNTNSTTLPPPPRQAQSPTKAASLPQLARSSTDPDRAAFLKQKLAAELERHALAGADDFCDTSMFVDDREFYQSLGSVLQIASQMGGEV
jgi:hypothetical protein